MSNVFFPLDICGSFNNVNCEMVQKYSLRSATERDHNYNALHEIENALGVPPNYQTFQKSTNSRQLDGWVCRENQIVDNFDLIAFKVFPGDLGTLF